MTENSPPPAKRNSCLFKLTIIACVSLLVKDVAFYRKYLQQHDRQVFVTGQHYLLVTAVARPLTAPGA